jgi:hypothetical protein
MVKPSGKLLWMQLIEPTEWIEAVGAQAGKTIDVALPDMGVSGPAQVISIGPCPPIKPGPGNVVTGIFVQESDGNLLSLELAGQAERTLVTDTHPYWSVDREAFVPVSELRPGERLDTMAGTTTVVSVTRHARDELVYNVRTHRDHVYRVGSLGTLVHNTCPEPGAAHSAGRGVYGVGLAKDLRRNPILGTQVNHVPQSRQAESLIGNFSLRNNIGNEPAIRLPISEHEAVNAAQRMRRAPASARDLLADEIRILRNNTNAPNAQLKQLIELNRKLHPTDYLRLHWSNP